MHLSGSASRDGFAGVRLSITNTRRLLLHALAALWERTEGWSFAAAPEQAGEAEASLLALEGAMNGSGAVATLGEERLFWLLGACESAGSEDFLKLHVAHRKTPEGAEISLAAVYDRRLRRAELFFEVLRYDEALGTRERPEDFEDAHSALLEFFSERSAGVAPI